MRRRAPRWILLLPFAAASLLLGVAIAVGGGGPPEPAPWVHPAEVELDDFPDWADPRWRTELKELLAGWPAFRADDEGAPRRLEEDLAALSFVSTVEFPRVDERGELRLGLRLRRPAAAITVGQGYLAVDGQGVILSGAWIAPPRCGELWLPVLRGRGAEPPRGSDFKYAQPGDWLDHPGDLAALEVARSLFEHLGSADLVRLGRTVIELDDAEVKLLLEGQRLALFGRPPSAETPGDLPTALKWAALSDALALLDQGGEAGSWDLVDLRWDVPELRLRGDAGGSVAARTLPAPRAEAEASAVPSSLASRPPRPAEASGPRVR